MGSMLSFAMPLASGVDMLPYLLSHIPWHLQASPASIFLTVYTPIDSRYHTENAATFTVSAPDDISPVRSWISCHGTCHSQGVRWL